MEVWEPRAKSKVEQGSIGKTGVYMGIAAFCGEREWVEEVQSGIVGDPQLGSFRGCWKDGEF